MTAGTRHLGNSLTSQNQELDNHAGAAGTSRGLMRPRVLSYHPYLLHLADPTGQFFSLNTKRTWPTDHNQMASKTLAMCSVLDPQDQGPFGALWQK